MSAQGDVNSALACAGGLGNRLSNIENALGRIEGRISSLESRLISVEGNVAVAVQLIKSLEGTITQLIKSLENTIKTLLSQGFASFLALLQSLENIIRDLIARLLGGDDKESKCLTFDDAIRMAESIRGRIASAESTIIETDNKNTQILFDIIQPTIQRIYNMEGILREILELIKKLKLTDSGEKCDLTPILLALGALSGLITGGVTAILAALKLLGETLAAAISRIKLNLEINPELKIDLQPILNATLNLDAKIEAVLRCCRQLESSDDGGDIDCQGIKNELSLLKNAVLNVNNNINISNDNINNGINNINNNITNTNTNINNITNNITTTIDGSVVNNLTGTINNALTATIKGELNNVINTQLSMINNLNASLNLLGQIKAELNVSLQPTLNIENKIEIINQQTKPKNISGNITTVDCEGVEETLAFEGQELIGVINALKRVNENINTVHETVCSLQTGGDCIAEYRTHKTVYPYSYHLSITWYDKDKPTTRYPDIIVAGIDKDLDWASAWDDIKDFEYIKGNVHGYIPLRNYSTPVMSGNFNSENEADRVLIFFTQFLDSVTLSQLVKDENDKPVRTSKGARKINIITRILKIERLLVVDTNTSEALYCFRNKKPKKQS